MGAYSKSKFLNKSKIAAEKLKSILDEVLEILMVVISDRTFLFPALLLPAEIGMKLLVQLGTSSCKEKCVLIIRLSFV